MGEKTLREAIERAINCNSAENGSNTPDFMLAEFLTDCLAAFDRTVRAREKWYGRDPGIGPTGMRTDGQPTPLDAPLGPAPYNPLPGYSIVLDETGVIRIGIDGNAI